MCTIGYHQKSKLLFKNRDKVSPIEEVIIARPSFLAVKTEGEHYYSVGINRYGCGFVSAAVNTTRWTQLVFAAKEKEARLQSEKENEGLTNPMLIVSKTLPYVRTVDEVLEKLLNTGKHMRGYNIILADVEKTAHVELYRDLSRIKWLKQDTCMTNHFAHLRHGPNKIQDYPSSYKRLKLVKEKIKEAISIEDIFQMLTTRNGKDDEDLWRSGVFSTVSSSILDLEAHAFYYTSDPDMEYARITSSTPAKGAEKIFIEMSRYIDLPTYHNIERGHPFYVEMIEEIKSQIQLHYNQPNKKLKTKSIHVLELGAGTGLCSLELVKVPFIQLSALEIDNECCGILSSHPELAKSTIISDDAVTYRKKYHYDIVVSTFAHDHIHYNKRFQFAKNIYHNLKKGGFYIMGGELLSFFSNDLERKIALFRYHNYIITEALTQGRVQLAELENNALKSGLDMVGDFKRHEGMFEEEMESAGFKLVSKKKIGPLEHDDRGGVFVYVYQKV